MSIDIEKEREELIRFFGVDSDSGRFAAAADAATLLYWRARLIEFLQAERAEQRTPDAFNLRLRAQLEQEWVELQDLKRAEQRTPPGYVLVPVEPTQEMQKAGATQDAMNAQRVATPESRACNVYRAMLAADAPPAPQAAQREPLTDERIDALWEKVCSAASHGAMVADLIRSLARAIEAAQAPAQPLVDAQILRDAAQLLDDAARLEQNSYDEPPEPATQWDYEAIQMAGALRHAADNLPEQAPAQPAPSMSMFATRADYEAAQAPAQPLIEALSVIREHCAAQPSALAAAIVATCDSALVAQAPAQPEACEHDWQIWPETDGLEQRCVKCGKYRATPLAQPAPPPAEADVADIIAGALHTSRAHAYELMRGALAEAQPSTASAVERVMAKLDLARQNVETVLRVEDGLEIGSLRKLNGVVAALRSAVEALAKGERA